MLTQVNNSAEVSPGHVSTHGKVQEVPLDDVKIIVYYDTDYLVLSWRKNKCTDSTIINAKEIAC